MAKKPHYQYWLESADQDFRFASRNLKDKEDKFYSQILFHLQQAAEKYLKAYIVFKNLLFQKIHDLPELIAIIKKVEPSFNLINEEALFLNDFYTDTRYPVYWPTGYDFQTALKAQESALRIGAFVKEKIRK